MEVSIREKLHKLIEDSSNEKLEHMYQLLQEDEYSDEFKAMLDKEYDDYMQNEEGISSEEVDKIVSQYLYGKNN